MRRKNDRDIIKENILFLISGCAGILLGIFFLLSPFLPSTLYEEYQEKEIMISEVKRFSGGRWGTASHLSILTDEGESYFITGEFVWSDLPDLLHEGTIASIKYRINRVFPILKYSEEMTVNGELIVKYNNDEPVNWVMITIMSVISISLGIVFLCLFRFFVVRNRKIQKKREAKIIRKYGNTGNK